VQNHDASSSAGVQGSGHAKRSRKQQRPQQVMRFVPDAHGPPQKAATAMQGQPRAHQPHRQHQCDHVEVKEEDEDSYEEAEEEEAEEEEAVKEEEEEVSYEDAAEAEDDDSYEKAAEEEEEEEEEEADEEEGDAAEEEVEEEGKQGQREQHAQAPGGIFEGRVAPRARRARLPPVRYADYEDEDEGEDNGNVSGTTRSRRTQAEDNGVSWRTSQFKGVCWDKRDLAWRASCRGHRLGNHATEEDAAQAYDNYVKDGVLPVPRRAGTSTSQFKGVCWHKRGKWAAECNGIYLGRAVQVDPIKPKLKTPGTNLLTLNCDEPLSTFAFKFNLRRYTLGTTPRRRLRRRRTTPTRRMVSFLQSPGTPTPPRRSGGSAG